MKTIHKKHILLAMAGILMVTIALVIISNALVVRYSRSRVFDCVDSIPFNEVGLLLGTTPQTRIGGQQNMFFKYRIDAAEELFKAGKINRILISGDEDSLDGVNEPECMKDSLVARGIPGDVISLDGKGYRTLDSVVRAREVFGVSSFTVISQRFHNERALYLAGHLRLDVEDIMAFNAENPTSAMSMKTYVREYFARVKMFLDILINKQPASLDGVDK